MDGDDAAGAVFAAADARGADAAVRGQRAGAGDVAGVVCHPAGVDVEDVGRCGGRDAVIIRNRDARGGRKLCAVEEDEADLASDRDTGVGAEALAGHDVPAGRPLGGEVLRIEHGVAVEDVGPRRDRRRVVGVADRGHGGIHRHVPIAGIVACLFGDTVGRRRRAAEDHEAIADGQCAVAAAVFAAADAHGAFAAGRDDRAAVDIDRAAGLPDFAADARGVIIAIRSRGQRAGAGDRDAFQVAGVDVEGIALIYRDAFVRVQRHAVAEDEVDRAADRDAACEIECRAGGVVPGLGTVSAPARERVVLAQLDVARDGAGLYFCAACRIIVLIVHRVRAPRDHVPASVARYGVVTRIPGQALRGIPGRAAVDVQIGRDGESAVVAAAVVMVASADAHGAADAALCVDRAAVDFDRAAGAFVAAADARAFAKSGRVDRAAVDGDAAAGTGAAAANTRAADAAGRVDRAAVDGDAAAGAVFAAADARSAVAALRGDRAAVDGDDAAGAVFAATDARALVAAFRGQRAGACDCGFRHAAGVDVEDVGRRGGRIVVVIRNRDAIGRCQLRAVEEDEADLAGDRDAVCDLNVRAGHDVPAGRPVGGEVLRIEHGVAVADVDPRRDRRAFRRVVGVADRGHGGIHRHVPIAGIVAFLFGDEVACRRRAAEDHEAIADDQCAVAAAVFAAADAHGAVAAAGRDDRAAVDGERAAGALAAAADARAAAVAGRGDLAAVDSDAAAGAFVAAADARAVAFAGRGDRAAVDGDLAAGAPAAAADARAAVAGRGQRAGAGDRDAFQVAGVDVEGVASLNRDALGRVQRHAVAEDEVDRAADLDGDCEIECRAGGVVPAVCPCPELVVLAQLGVGRDGAGLPDRFAVCKLIVYIVHGVRAPRDHVPASVARYGVVTRIPGQALRGIRTFAAVDVQIGRDGESAVVAAAAALAVAAADAHGLDAAVCGDRAAGDGDRAAEAGAVVAAAAADASAAFAAAGAVCFDRAAADGDRAALAAFFVAAAAADASAAYFAAAAGCDDRAASDGDYAAVAAGAVAEAAAADASAAGAGAAGVVAAAAFRDDRAAGDGKAAAGAAVAAADTRAAVVAIAAAGRVDRAAVDGDLAAVFAAAAADASAAVSAAACFDRAAVDGDVSALAVGAAAYARAGAAAGRADRSAVYDERAAGAVVAAADARALVVAGRGDFAAVDGDHAAAGAVVAAADARGAVCAGRGELAAACDHGFRHAAGVDVEDVGRCGGRIVAVAHNRDARGGRQLRFVEEDEADLAGDRDAVCDLNVRAGHDVPAGRPLGGEVLRIEHGIAVADVGARRDRRACRRVVGVADRGHGGIHRHVPIAGIVAFLFGDEVTCRRRAAEDPEGVFVDGERAADAHTAGAAGRDDRAAVGGERAADAHTAGVAALRFDRAAVDGDAVAADARAAVLAGRGDRAAVDGETADADARRR